MGKHLIPELGAWLKWSNTTGSILDRSDNRVDQLSLHVDSQNEDFFCTPYQKKAARFLVRVSSAGLCLWHRGVTVMVGLNTGWF